jgi:SOS-response transcriptional repressor LexA
LVIATGGKVLSTDYIVSVTPTAMTKTEIANKDVVLVFKEGSAEEEAFVVTYVPTVLNGTIVMFTILARSKKK